MSPASNRPDHPVSTRLLASALALGAVLFLTSGTLAIAQSPTRNFQISLWECCATPQLPNYTPTSAQTDIHEFGYSTSSSPPQPTGGPSILVINNLSITVSQIKNVTSWAMIAAVEIDEPYGSLDTALGTCASPNSGIASIDNTLSNLATAIKAKNPHIRFWVNFTSQEAQWMINCQSAQAFNRTYIDVISTDWYNVYWSTVAPFYSLVAQNLATPYQQFALIPGVFSTQGLAFQDYFNYAQAANQTCSLPLPPQGATGLYDGCPVWIVFGWLSGDYQSYQGILDPASATILTGWQIEVAYTPVRKTWRQRGLPPIWQTLLR